MIPVNGLLVLYCVSVKLRVQEGEKGEGGGGELHARALRLAALHTMGWLEALLSHVGVGKVADSVPPHRSRAWKVSIS